MKFGQALYWLKQGEKLYRLGWNGEGMWIVLMPGLKLPAFNNQDTDKKVNDRTAKFIGKDTPLDSQPYIAMWTSYGEWQPGWVPSQADMFEEDWCIAK